jgi:uncharacterized membrane protein (UPF0127 family)
MARKGILILVLFTLSFLVYLKFSTQATKPAKFSKLILKDKIIQLEVADTDNLRALGLSNRISLCQNCGMIFTFTNPGIYPFWMKDTLIPLDMLWLDENFKITTIHTALPEPNHSTWELTLYQNDTPSKYVLELNQNFAKNNGLKIGDQLEIRL